MLVELGAVGQDVLLEVVGTLVGDLDGPLDVVEVVSGRVLEQFHGVDELFAGREGGPADDEAHDEEDDDEPETEEETDDELETDDETTVEADETDEE